MDNFLTYSLFPKKDLLFPKVFHKALEVFFTKKSPEKNFVLVTKTGRFKKAYVFLTRPTATTTILLY
ncbi:MAG: hypothetical protein A2Y57_01760 [Candidatus Woykebacteria bacterium RBG_13_40_7b]|uniref:Uncharacterized protein n=1 Tax=Candidatus Woykebacteria bacterium RBG_13_40_7b TaxID=1802594 RepID=A0A1G1WAU7_9BACT|nr:MAG: hypothetical protein A2Y57_01760 [Candidatus Woykebacteria bacterium RBG_13_40_7b]